MKTQIFSRKEKLRRSAYDANIDAVMEKIDGVAKDRATFSREVDLRNSEDPATVLLGKITDILNKTRAETDENNQWTARVPSYVGQVAISGKDAMSEFKGVPSRLRTASSVLGSSISIKLANSRTGLFLENHYDQEGGGTYITAIRYELSNADSFLNNSVTSPEDDGNMKVASLRATYTINTASVQGSLENRPELNAQPEALTEVQAQISSAFTEFGI